jgi:hypothetical protein
MLQSGSNKEKNEREIIFCDVTPCSKIQVHRRPEIRILPPSSGEKMSQLAACFLLAEYLIFDHEYEGNGFLRNIGELRPDYTASFSLTTVSACRFCCSLLA